MAWFWESDEPSPGGVCCSQGHRPSTQVLYGHDRAICLECFSELITAPSSLGVHRAGALTEFQEALKDAKFCHSLLMQKRAHRLGAPLLEAICSTEDEVLSTALVEVIRDVCMLALDTDATLLQEFLLHAWLQLSSNCSTIWGRGHRFRLHALSLLLEFHCLQHNHVPQSMKFQPDFMHNVLNALKIPCDELRTEILSLLYNVATLQDGVENIHEFCPSLVSLSIQALRKTHSDPLRTNCIDGRQGRVRLWSERRIHLTANHDVNSPLGPRFLSALAQASVFDISFLPDGFEEKTNSTILSQETAETSHFKISFLKQFAEAVNISLMSTETQIHIEVLQLICLVCPQDKDISEEVCILIDEGITDHIFELLRASGDLHSVANVAIQALGVLCNLAPHAFSLRFCLGVEPLLRVLEHTFSSAFCALQTDTLVLMSTGISDRPGVLSASCAEQLTALLQKLLHKYAIVMEDHSISDTSGYGLTPDGLNATCQTLLALMKAPLCTSIPSIFLILYECLTDMMDCISRDEIYALHSDGLRFATQLLQESFLFSMHQDFGNSPRNDLIEASLDLCESKLLPVIVANMKTIADEDTVLAVFRTVELFLRNGHKNRTSTFANNLVSGFWISLAFQAMSRFPSKQLKQTVYECISVMLDELSSCGDLIRGAIPYLPTDVEDLLITLESRCSENMQLIQTHQAIIALLFTTHTYGDRLVEDNQLRSSLEQHLMVNNVSALNMPPSPTFQQFFSLYISARESTDVQNYFYSTTAEAVMVKVLRQAYMNGTFVSELSISAIKWILQRETLLDVSKKLLLLQFTRANEQSNHPFHSTLAQLVEQDDCVTEALLSLFLEEVERHHEEEIRVVATGITTIIRRNSGCASKFHNHGAVSTLRRFILLQGAKAPEPTLTSCAELLFNLLLWLDPEMTVDEGAWIDIASQVMNYGETSSYLHNFSIGQRDLPPPLFASLEKLVLTSMDGGHTVRSSTVPLLNLVALIMHKCVTSSCLLEAAYHLCSSKELRRLLESNIIGASQKGPRLSVMEFNSHEWMTLSNSLLFHLLWLRCEKTNYFRSQRRYDKDHEESQTTLSNNNHNEDLVVESIKGATQKIQCSFSISYQHLSQILCYGNLPVQSLTSSCLVEILCPVTDDSREDARPHDNLPFENLCESPVRYLEAVSLIMQGAFLSGNGLLRENMGLCISRLLITNRFNPQQKKAVERSSWYKLVAEKSLESITPSSQAELTSKEEIYSCTYVLLAILQASPPYSWVPLVFNSQAVAAIIASTRSSVSVPVVTVCLFVELLKGSLLDRQQVETMCDLFQALRRKVLRERIPDVQTTPCFWTDLQHMDSGSQIMQLALYDRKDPLASLCADVYSSDLNGPSLLLIKIDEFLQRSARSP